MQTIIDLRNDLIENYQNIKSNSMTLKMGKELANTAGKILASAKLELEYNQYMGIKNEIAFLNVEKTLEYKQQKKIAR